MVSTPILTPKQRTILEFIQQKQLSGDPPPSLREIATHFGFASKTAARDHISALQKKGMLERNKAKRKARGLRLAGALGNLRRRVVTVPLFGSIPAGFPDNLDQLAEGKIAIDLEALGLRWTKRTFALRVRGDSMIGKCICDGDLAILEHGADPRPGQVVAALIDGESTLKTFVSKNNRTFLKAENPKYPALIPAQELTIQGVLKGLFRKTQE